MTETALATQILGPDGRPWTPTETRTTLRDPADWLLEWALGERTTSGERVNEQIAMGLSAWFGGIRVISEDVAKLPLIMYSRRPDGGKDRATGHPLYRLLHDSPNPDHGAMVFEETILQHAIGWGNGYAEIVRDTTVNRNPLELWPLDPSAVTPSRRGSDSLFYRVMMETGGFVDLPAEDVLHIHGLGPMGDSGYNVTRIAREALGVHLALQKFAGSFFAGGATVGAVLEHPGALSDKALAHLRTTFTERHGGAENAHKVLITEEGMKYQQLGIAPEQGQMNLSRIFSIQDVCRWLRITPSKLFELSHATFSNVEQQALSHVGDTLQPWMTRIEQEINRKLLPAGGRYFVEHLVDSILRADIKTRNESYKIAIEGGWMSRNEVRIRENLDPKPGLDEMLEPTVGGTQAVGAEPAPAGEPEPADDDTDDDTRALAVCRRLAAVHRPVLAERFRVVLKRENSAMKRDKDARADYMSDHSPYVRSILIPAVDTFCSTVWCVINDGCEMPDVALRSVAEATAAMSGRHMERVNDRSADNWVPWPVVYADVWAETEMNELAASMAAICKEHANGS